MHLTMAESMSWLDVFSFNFGLSMRRTMTNGFFIICCAKKSTLAFTDCMSCKADPATNTTEQVFGVFIPLVPSVRSNVLKPLTDT